MTNEELTAHKAAIDKLFEDVMALNGTITREQAADFYARATKLRSDEDKLTDEQVDELYLVGPYAGKLVLLTQKLCSCVRI